MTDLGEHKRPFPPKKPYFPEDDIETISNGVKEILRSGSLTLGKYTKEFEQEFAKYAGVRHAISANSGTCTLEMIYKFIDVKDREVITPTNTHISTSNAVLFAGGKPILADMDPQSLCIDVEDAFSKVTKKTKAIVVVHIAGLIHPQMDEIRERCDKLGIILIEDAAHAHGAIRNGRKAGALAYAGSFSFYPSKVMTSFEGGMITTDNSELDEFARQMRNHGNDSRDLQVKLGYNWRMDEIHALTGLVQLRRLEEIIMRKERIARAYTEVLEGEDNIKIIGPPKGTRHAYYKYPITFDKGIDVKSMQATLKSQYKIDAGPIYIPCHLMPIYRELFGYHEGSLPVSEEVLGRTVGLPTYTDMNEEDATYAAETMLKVLKEQKK